MCLSLPYSNADPEYHISSDIRQSFFSFQNNPKNLDLSHKMGIDLWDSIGKVKLELGQTFMGLIFCSNSREGTTSFYSLRNTVLGPTCPNT